MGLSTDRTAGQRPLVGVVGPCGSGKSLLVGALRKHGFHAREIAQEHSYVLDMWKRITNPDFLIYLNVSREVAEVRQQRELPLEWWRTLEERLAHARAHADPT